MDTALASSRAPTRPSAPDPSARSSHAVAEPSYLLMGARPPERLEPRSPAVLHQQQQGHTVRTGCFRPKTSQPVPARRLRVPVCPRAFGRNGTSRVAAGSWTSWDVSGRLGTSWDVLVRGRPGRPATTALENSKRGEAQTPVRTGFATPCSCRCRPWTFWDVLASSTECVECMSRWSYTRGAGSTSCRTSLRTRVGGSAVKGRAVRPCRRQPRRGDLDGRGGDGIIERVRNRRDWWTSRASNGHGDGAAAARFGGLRATAGPSAHLS